MNLLVRLPTYELTPTPRRSTGALRDLRRFFYSRQSVQPVFEALWVPIQRDSFQVVGWHGE